MDPAAPVEAPDGIRLAPPLHRLGPLLGHVVLREALQGAHELAVDDPCRERIEVPGDRRHPGFVEQRQTLLDIAVQDEQPGLCYPSDGARRRVTLRTHLDGTPGPLPSAGRVAGQHPLVGADDRKPRVRRRLTLTFEKPLRSCQPAAHRCHERSVEEQVHRDANGCTCGRDLVAGLHARGVGALPRLDGHIEMAGRVGDLAKAEGGLEESGGRPRPRPAGGQKASDHSPRDAASRPRRRDRCPACCSSRSPGPITAPKTDRNRESYRRNP